MRRHRCRPPLSRTVNRTNIFWGTNDEVFASCWSALDVRLRLWLLRTAAL